MCYAEWQKVGVQRLTKVRKFHLGIYQSAKPGVQPVPFRGHNPYRCVIILISRFFFELAIKHPLHSSVFKDGSPTRPGQQLRRRHREERQGQRDRARQQEQRRKERDPRGDQELPDAS
jgi:hypothetical protein